VCIAAQLAIVESRLFNALGFVPLQLCDVLVAAVLHEAAKVYLSREVSPRECTVHTLPSGDLVF